MADDKATEENPVHEDTGRGFRFGGGHGALFHLEQLAYYQALYRTGAGSKVKDVEAHRVISFFENQDDIPTPYTVESELKNDLFRRVRKIDIVLQGETERQEKWIELKSYKAKSETNRGELDIGAIGKWTLAVQSREAKAAAKTYPSLHRQFVLDRVAANEKVAWLAKNQSPRNRIDVVVNVIDFQWKFQKFKLENKKTKYKAISPDLASKYIRGRLGQKPKVGAWGKKTLEVSYNPSANIGMTTHVVESGIKSTIQDVLPKLGFGLIKDAAEEFELE